MLDILFSTFLFWKESLLTAEYDGVVCRFDILLDATVNSICPAVRNSVSLDFFFP